jgi:hypothetical protein
MDDRWPSSKKLRRVEPLDRLLWVMSIAYCSEQNTDGRLDGPMLELIAFLAGKRKQRQMTLFECYPDENLWATEG